jgi:hypothetical protein
MSTVIEATIGALEPWVGRMAADTCVRATALAAGKMSSELTAADLPAIDASIRRLLSPIAPGTTIDTILKQIHGAAL